MSVRQRLDTVARAGDAGEGFGVRVPRVDVLVANRPVDRDAVFRIRFEVQITVSIALSAPHQRTASDVVTAIPVEALRFCIRRILVAGPPVEIFLVQRIVALEDGVFRFHGLGVATAMRILPRAFLRVGVVLHMLDVLTALEHQNLQSLFGQVFGGPAARNA